MLLVGWIVGVITMNIYGMSGDALLHCFLVEIDLNKSALKATTHLPELKEFIEAEKDE
jgi:hypothetical protein